MRNGIAMLLVMVSIATVAALVGGCGGGGLVVGELAFYDASDDTRPLINPATDIHVGVPFVLAPKEFDIATFDPAGYTFTVIEGSDIVTPVLWLLGNGFVSRELAGNAVIEARQGDKVWRGALVEHL